MNTFMNNIHRTALFLARNRYIHPTYSCPYEKHSFDLDRPYIYEV